MHLSQNGLLAMLQKNVVEIKFARRHLKLGWDTNRRMLCTNCFEILNSVPGKYVLHFKRPTQPPAYDWRSRNLVCTWDLLWQDWRMISVEWSNIITVIPCYPLDRFWNYFNIYVQGMSPGEKIDFMNK